MKKTIYINMALLTFSIFIMCQDASAWDDKITHKDLSEYAAYSSILRKCVNETDLNCDYLKNLGLKGLDKDVLEWDGNKTIKRGYIKDWLREGAILEDSSGPLSVGYIDSKGRSFNHFHNPLKPWAQAGLDDWVGPLHFTGKSSLLWTQDGASQENFYEGNWSWNKTREYYYTALTSKEGEAKKKEYFAKTFRGLGHQMHLLQDTAVPEHMRNDAHPEDALFGKNRLNGSRYFETWAKEEIPDIDEMKVIASAPLFPNVPMNIPLQGLVPITQLYDTDQYDGLNASAGINQGLAEYTNANFFSGDTIFAAERYPTDNRHYFPFPRRASTDLARFIAGTKPVETIVDEEGNTKTGIWISKISDGEDVGHLAKTSALTRLAYNVFGEGEVFYSTFYKDEKCHEDYAKTLIPRAVGYSTALLNYFFRGSIEIALPSSGIYASTGDPQTGFRRIVLRVQNKTANGEEMTDGSIELVVIYKLALEDPFQSQPVQTTTDYLYKIVPELNNVRSISKNTPVELAFDLGSNSLPVNAVDVSLQLVYHGRLGNEDGAVAVGFKDINEPTPIDIYNNMDKICLNSSWYEAGSPAAVEIVDINSDGVAYGQNEWDVYPHVLKNLYVKFYNAQIEPDYASPSVYDYLVSDIPVEGFMRAIYVLGDNEFHYSFYAAREKMAADDNWTHIDNVSLYHGYTLKIQAGDFPVMYNFRGRKMWSGSGFIYINAPFPESAQCSLSSL